MVTKWASDQARARNEHIHQIVRDHFRVSNVVFEGFASGRALFLSQRAAARSIRARNRAAKAELSESDIREAERDAREAAFDALLATGQTPDQGALDQAEDDRQEFEDDWNADQRQRKEDEEMVRPAWSGQIPFIFIAEETSGVSTREVRSWGPAPTRYSITNIHIHPFDTPSKFHKLSIVLTNYPHETDATYPTGAPIFLKTEAPTGIGVSEKEDKMRWPDSPIDIPGSMVALKAGDYISVINEYEDPAAYILDGQVIITIEDAGAAAIARIEPSRQPEVPIRITPSRPSGLPYQKGFRSYSTRQGATGLTGRRFFTINPDTQWTDLPNGAMLSRSIPSGSQAISPTAG